MRRVAAASVGSVAAALLLAAAVVMVLAAALPDDGIGEVAENVPEVVLLLLAVTTGVASVMLLTRLPWARGHRTVGDANARSVGFAPRVLLGLTAAALALVGLWVSVFAGLGLPPGPPDPEIVDGDPCCTHPDTWTQLLIALALGLVPALLGGAVLLASAWAARIALHGVVIARPGPALGAVLVVPLVYLALGAVAVIQAIAGSTTFMGS